MSLIPDLQSITHIVEEAGKNILIPYFFQQNQQQDRQSNIHTKLDGSIVTQADLECQTYLQKHLSKLAPNIAFLGEEMTESDQWQCLQSKVLFWCVDPLDGTSNFATPMPLFAISVALIQEGHPILACVYDPIRQEMFTAIRGKGLSINGQAPAAIRRLPLNESVGFLDFKRLPEKLSIMFATQSVYRSQRNMGTCALEWAWLAAGRAQFIVHGGEKLWDYAAGSLLAEEAACVVSNFEGHPLFADQTLSSSIVAAIPSIHPTLQGYCIDM